MRMRMRARRYRAHMPVSKQISKVHACVHLQMRVHTHKHACICFAGNLISAGVREQIRFLVQHSMVDVVVTTAGGIEEDFIKCLGHTYIGDFQLKGGQMAGRWCMCEQLQVLHFCSNTLPRRGLPAL